MELTALDKELLRIANEDPERFIKIIREDNWINAKACLLRINNNSYGQIINKLPLLTKSKIETICKKCEGF